MGIFCHFIHYEDYKRWLYWVKFTGEHAPCTHSNATHAGVGTPKGAAQEIMLGRYGVCALESC